MTRKLANYGKYFRSGLTMKDKINTARRIASDKKNAEKPSSMGRNESH